MDLEVIQDLFNRAVSQGYTKTIDEFSNLLITDTEVLQDNYNYVQSKGYNKSIEDFQNLVGVKKKRRYGFRFRGWFIGISHDSNARSD